MMTERGCYSLMVERNNNRKPDTYLGYEQFYNKKKYQKLDDMILLKKIRTSGWLGFGSFLKNIKDCSWNARYSFDRQRKGVKI